MSEESSNGVAVHVTTIDHGPYVVAAGVPLVVRRPANTEHGEQIAWLASETLNAGDGYALCRCGGSQNKPFCDGTHAREGFDGSCPASEGSVKDYAGTGIVVHDNRERCTHAGFCGNRLTNVWKMVGDADDTQVRAQIVAMVERCPSGALSYSLVGPDISDEPVEPDLPTQIAVTPDGPLWLTGGVSVSAPGGTMLPSGNRVTLCRCGASANKPYCDGTHQDIGFRDES